MFSRVYLSQVGSEDHIAQASCESLAGYTEHVAHDRHTDTCHHTNHNKHDRIELRILLLLVVILGKNLVKEHRDIDEIRGYE